MRIWHPDLIPQLCTKHFVACWREALGAYSIITGDKQGYRNHPATQEYIDCPEALHGILSQIKEESIKRGYNFKDVPPKVTKGGSIKPWQTIGEQILALKEKPCECNPII
jgi:hypothetical protein